ncbi:MAG: hypothetical protein ACI4LT_09555 [Treponema sp.]
MINDVFGENGRYKNQDSFDAFIEHSKFYGFDFIKCSVINNFNNSQCLKLEFKILKELPKLKIPKESSPQFVYCPDDFEKLLPESTGFKVCNAFATVTEFLRNCLGDGK